MKREWVSRSKVNSVRLYIRMTRGTRQVWSEERVHAQCIIIQSLPPNDHLPSVFGISNHQSLLSANMRSSNMSLICLMASEGVGTHFNSSHMFKSHFEISLISCGGASYGPRFTTFHLPPSAPPGMQIQPVCQREPIFT